MSIEPIKLDQGIHLMHLFYKVNRNAWWHLEGPERKRAMTNLQQFLNLFPGPAHPRVSSFANVGGKADFAFIIYHEDLVKLGEMHHELEACFPPNTIELVYNFLSVTELPEYVTTEEDMKKMLIHQEKLSPGSEDFDQRLGEMKSRFSKYEHYRLYPEMQDWEIMCFYPMLKKRQGADNWYSLDFPTRKKLMTGHAKVGREYAGRVSQLITGSTGLDDWEWGVTLIAHQLDAIKDIVYEMRFDEVSAKYGEFGPFYINIRLSPEDLWDHLKLH